MGMKQYNSHNDLHCLVHSNLSINCIVVFFFFFSFNIEVRGIPSLTTVTGESAFQVGILNIFSHRNTVLHCDGILHSTASDQGVHITAK